MDFWTEDDVPVTPTEIASLLKQWVPQTIRRWLDAGKIPMVVTHGRHKHRRCKMSDVLRFAERNGYPIDPEAYRRIVERKETP